MRSRRGLARAAGSTRITLHAEGGVAPSLVKAGGISIWGEPEPWAVDGGGGRLGLAVAVAMLAAGCSSGGGQSTGSGGQAATATTLAPLAQPSSRCGAPDVKATVLRFPAADGTQLDGVLAGSGPAGVVLLHQHPADLCRFWPYAVYLSKRGLQALAIDLRCYGESACPQADDAKSRVVDDVAGAVAGRRRGQPVDRQVRPVDHPGRLLDRPARLGPSWRWQRSRLHPFAAKVAGFVSAHTRS